MPIYEYLCPGCNLKFELRRSFSSAEENAPCPNCQGSARRVFSSFFSFAKSSDGTVTSIGGSSCSGCAATSCASCGLS